MSIYITVGTSNKKYYPQDWQFTAYQFLKIHIEDESDVTPYYYTASHEKVFLTEVDSDIEGYRIWKFQSHSSSGIIDIFYKEEKFQLTIFPSILEEKDFKRMALEIASFIFHKKSYTYFNEQVQTDIRANKQVGKKFGADFSKQYKKQEVFDAYLNKISDFLDSLEKNISVIINNSATSMRVEKQITQIKKSIKPQDLLKRKLQPHKKLTITHTKVYDDFSLENKWLAYIVYKQIPSFLELTNINNEKNRNYKKISNQLENIQKHNFLLKFKNTTTNIKPIITTKLKKSKGYSAILQAYQEIFHNEVVKYFNEYQATKKAYISGYIDNLSHIYEYWCLFSIYHNLLKRGFAVKGKGFEGCLKLDNNNLRLSRKDTSITLDKNYGKEKITITLSYEPELKSKKKNKNDGKDINYTPDIKIEFEQARGKSSVILDAKFYNYSKNNNGRVWKYEKILNGINTEKCLTKDKNLLADIIGTSMYKYNHMLIKEPNMSIILHPNSSKKFLWKGDCSLKSFLVDKSGILTSDNWGTLENKLQVLNSDNYDCQKMIDEINKYNPHKFGLFILREEKDVDELLNLIFTHLSIEK